jgi:uncharacterized membrane protein
MKTKGLLIVTLLLAAAMAVFGFCAASGLPVGAELPTHWTVSGKVDQTMPALIALMISPVMTLAIGLLFAVIPQIEPLQDKLDASAPLLRVAWIGVMALMVFIQVMIAGPALGFEIGRAGLLVVLGLMFIALGNFLPKSRPGFFVGIRTPWTITDTDNWIATHRIGGKLMILVGAAVMVMAILPLPAATIVPLAMGAILIATLFPVCFSWWFWRMHRLSD